MATVLNSTVSGVLINRYHLFLDPNSDLTLPWLLREPENRLIIFYTLLMFFITIILWLYPHFIQIVTLSCSTISIVGLYGYSILDRRAFLWPAMVSAQLLVLPLLWIWIVHHTTSWKGFITYLTLSLAGWGCGKLIIEITGQPDNQQVLIFAVIQTCLLGCVWVLDVIRERRVAQASRRTLVRSEYQDNAAEAAWEINEGVVHTDASQGLEELKAKKWPIICWYSLLLIPQMLTLLFVHILYTSYVASSTLEPL
ncbi:unnamed protein product [Clonostachys rhizophaga]|uniref:Uncharacterized protein n=1 Tax=Clonostachys rhizophaga TaxID=160324 RepID=A0A9N9VWL0_9HYPO|nr:unnamed protein product [Clonostachys rhizophaga]